MVDSVTIILDVEPGNHLKKDCEGDASQLRLGLIGVKIFGKEEYRFFDETNLEDLRTLLLGADDIVGFNLVGHNGLDYQILSNCSIPTEFLVPKTFDIMSAMIRAFGSFEGFSLDNLAEHTLKMKKKKTKAAN